MSVGRIVDGLKTIPAVWGRCYSVVAADLEYASEAFEEISPDAHALREIEAVSSARMHDRNLLLSGSAPDRPVGPFSAVLLDALSIRACRNDFPDESLGGWLCHSDERDAIRAAQTRFSQFANASSAVGLSAIFQVYSARVAGTFATKADVLKLLVGGQSANDPRRIADAMAGLRSSAIDGIVVDQDECRVTLLVLRGSAVSQMRQVRQIELQSEVDQTVADPRIDLAASPMVMSADPRISGRSGT